MGISSKSRVVLLKYRGKKQLCRVIFYYDLNLIYHKESLKKVNWIPALYQKIDATNIVKEKVLNNAGIFKNKM